MAKSKFIFSAMQFFIFDKALDYIRFINNVGLYDFFSSLFKFLIWIERKIEESPRKWMRKSIFLENYIYINKIVTSQFERLFSQQFHCNYFEPDYDYKPLYFVQIQFLECLSTALCLQTPEELPKLLYFQK